MRTKTVYLYRLRVPQADLDAFGRENHYTPDGAVSAWVVVNESADNICIAVTDLNGNHQQFDSYEAYHLTSWAEPRGLEVEIITRDIEVPD